jgi:hypothetical protein
LTLNDPDGGVLIVSYRIDSGPWSDLGSYLPGNTHLIELPVEAFDLFLDPGPDHTVTFNVSDGSNDVTETTKYRVNSPPALALQGDPNQSSFVQWSSETATITFTVTDADGDQDLSLLFSFDDSVQYQKADIVLSGSSVTWNFHPDWNQPVALAAGSHTLYVQANDGLDSGNTIALPFTVGASQGPFPGPDTENWTDIVVPSSNGDDNKANNGLSGGEIAGIVIGVIAAVAGAGVGAIFFLKKRGNDSNVDDDKAEV